MKTALCLFGEPRDVDKTYHQYKKTLMDPNGVEDVFVHGWHDHAGVGQLYNPSKESDGRYSVPNVFIRAETPALLYQLYNPKKCFLERQKKFNWQEFAHPDFDNPHVTHATVSMLWSAKKSIELMLDYEEENGILYDRIILLRSDIVFYPDSVFNFTQADPNTSYFLDQNNHPGGLNYWFVYGSRDRIINYSRMYYNLAEIRKATAFIPQLVVGYYCRKMLGWNCNDSLPVIGLLR
jgi:hypothetical protein